MGKGAGPSKTHERLKEQRADEKDQRQQEETSLGGGGDSSPGVTSFRRDRKHRNEVFLHRQASDVSAGEGRTAWTPPGAWLEKRKKGENDEMEPESPSTYLLMYLQNMKKKYIQKYPNTKYNQF